MYEYDVALSFAGEEREYVKNVAELLSKKGVKVFYDDFELYKMWGTFLPDFLYRLYSEKAKYCIIFISKNYVSKIMPNVERRAAIQRAIRERNEYILPAKFDDSELPGCPKDIHYTDLRKVNIQKFIKLILTKLGFSQSNNIKIPIVAFSTAVDTLRELLQSNNWHFEKKGRFSASYGYIEKKDSTSMIDKIAQKLAIIGMQGLAGDFYLDYEYGAVIVEGQLTSSGLGVMAYYRKHG